VLLCFVVVVFLVTVPANAQKDTLCEMAPINQSFVEHMSGYPKGSSMKEQSGGVLGYIPSPVDRSHLQVSKRLLLSYPAVYDLRVTGRLSPVRNQGDCGSCWAFATYASLESYLLPAEVHDFSENHLKNTHGFVWEHNKGGNATISTAYLVRWGGPVSEADDPYDPDSGVSPEGPLPLRKLVPEVIYLPNRSVGENPNWLKQAIVEGGAVYTSMYWNDQGDYWNEATNSYYDYSLYGNKPNHAVTIVGWDDNYSRGKFKLCPFSEGAFIVRNNWGDKWGQDGYFYVSYDDMSFACEENILFHSAVVPNYYNRIYQYDPLGHVASLGYTDRTTCWGANIFEAFSEESVVAVGLYALDNNTSYTIKVYTDVDAGEPSSGILKLSDSGIISHAGYHTVNLSTPVDLECGQYFSVVVKFTTPNYTYPLAMEMPVAGFADATAGPGESFHSDDGDNWRDFSTNFKDANACIKALTVYDFMLGDINGDSRIDVSDAILILRNIVGLTELGLSQMSAADVNGDSRIDVSDAILVLRYIVGLISEFPEG